MAELLDLDATAFADLLTDVVARTAALAPGAARVVDLGAGTGTGTLLLAQAFPAAEIVAVDSSAAMLTRLRSAADAAGIGDRVRTVQADLDDGWPPVAGPDLVWAASSLHHVVDPERLLRGAHDALAPGGVVAVVEMTATTPVLPDGAARPGFERRLEEALAHAGWNRYPDWTPFLRAAGLEVLSRDELRSEPGPGPEVTRWVRVVLERQRTGLAEHLDPEDRAAIDGFLAAPDSPPPHGPGARSGRTLWAARRPHSTHR